METKENSLVEIPFEKLPDLRDKFKVEWPKHVLAFSVIHNFICRYLNTSKDKFSEKILCLNGDWESDGTFIYLTSKNHVLFGTLEPSQDKIKTALRKLDYSKEVFFMCLRKAYRSTIDTLIRDLSLNVIFDDGTFMKFMRKEDAKQFNIEIPEKFVLRTLSKENAQQINAIWPHRAEGSVKFIEYMIEFNANVGLFHTDSNELVAWCLRLDFGSLAVLQVEEKYQRKGFAALVTKAICKKIADGDEDISSNIVLDNVKSLSLFKKLGFIDIDKNYWIMVVKP